MENGIETALCEWWLTDSDFLLNYMEFEDWRDAMEDSILWDQIELWETWHEEEVLYNKVWDEFR